MLSPTLRYIHLLLEIPPQIQKQIFPDTSLSVLDFLKFPLPIISGAASQHTTAQFFSNHKPTTEDVKVIQKIPILPAKNVAELVVACKAAVILGTQLVKCQHAPSASRQNLPVWVITYWAEVLELRSTFHKPWLRAEEFIRLQKKVWRDMTCCCAFSGLVISVDLTMRSRYPWWRHMQAAYRYPPCMKTKSLISCTVMCCFKV